MKKNLYLIPIAIAVLLGFLYQPNKTQGASPEFMNPGWLTRVRTVSSPGCTVATNAITITSAGGDYGSTSNANVYFYPSFTPSAAGNTIMAIVSYSPNVNTCYMTNTGNTQLSWWLAGIRSTNSFATNIYNSGAQTLAIYVTQLPPGVAPFAMRPVFVTSSGTGINFSVLDITGADTNLMWGENAIYQVSKVSSNGVPNPRVTWGTPQAGDKDALIMAVADNNSTAGDVTAGTGFTEVADLAYNTPATGLHVQYKLLIPTTTTFGTNNMAGTPNWGGLAVELRAGTNACGYADPPWIPPSDGNYAKFYVDTASETYGGTGLVTNQVTGTDRAFKSALECVTNTYFRNTNAIRVVYMKGVTNDTNAIVQANWDGLTNAYSNRIIFIGDNDTGVWDDNKFTWGVTNKSAIYCNNQTNIPSGNIWVVNCQVDISSTTSTSADYVALRLCTANIAWKINEVQQLVNSGYVGCMVRLRQTGTDNVRGFEDSDCAVLDVRNRVRRINCIVFTPAGFGTADTTGNQGFCTATTYPFMIENYNCGSYSNDVNYTDQQIIVNCWSSLDTSGADLGFSSVGNGQGFSRNNSNGGTSTAGPYTKINAVFSFVSESTGDFDLNSGDTGAKALGIDDPLSGFFRIDIEGNTRTSPWDIGPHKVN